MTRRQRQRGPVATPRSLSPSPRPWAARCRSRPLSSLSSSSGPLAGWGRAVGGLAYPALARRMARTAAVLRALHAAWVGCVALCDLCALGPEDVALLGPLLVAGRVRDFAALALHEARRCRRRCCCCFRR